MESEFFANWSKEDLIKLLVNLTKNPPDEAKAHNIKIGDWGVNYFCDLVGALNVSYRIDDYDALTINKKRIEIKTAWLREAIDRTPVLTWNSIFGRRAKKKFDSLILVGLLLDKTKIYFDIPFEEAFTRANFNSPGGSFQYGPYKHKEGYYSSRSIKCFRVTSKQLIEKYGTPEKVTSISSSATNMLHCS